jgi:hypothetical protein
MLVQIVQQTKSLFLRTWAGLRQLIESSMLRVNDIVDNGRVLIIHRTYQGRLIAECLGAQSFRQLACSGKGMVPPQRVD